MQKSEDHMTDKTTAGNGVLGPDVGVQPRASDKPSFDGDTVVPATTYVAELCERLELQAVARENGRWDIPTAKLLREAAQTLRESEERLRRAEYNATEWKGHFKAAEAALKTARKLLEGIAEECEDRGEADLVEGAYKPDSWMSLGTRIRQFLKP